MIRPTCTDHLYVWIFHTQEDKKKPQTNTQTGCFGILTFHLDRCTNMPYLTSVLTCWLTGSVLLFTFLTSAEAVGTCRGYSTTSIPQQPDFFTLKFMSLPLCSAFQNPELSKPAVDVHVEMHYCFLLCSFLVAQ